MRFLILDRYILRQMLGTMGAVLAVVMSIMLLEHLSRLMEIARLSGHRGYIIKQTVTGLLPEYGGIGLLVGLFLGVALTIRKLALRGELDVIEACGTGPLRWMRLPLIFAAVVSLLTFANQGWLLPSAEAKLAEITHRVELGEFGRQLPAGQFIDLGTGNVLQFHAIDAANGELLGLFLRTADQTFTARRGRFWMLRSGAAEIVLYDGQIMRAGDTGVLQFARFQYRVEEPSGAWQEGSQDSLLKQVDTGSLWSSGTTSGRAVVYGRCLWAALALLLPLLALVLGKPPRRQSGAVGVLIGLTLLVLCLKLITPLTDGRSSNPELLATGILAAWLAFTIVLIRAEKAFGQGFVDLWASRIFRDIQRRSKRKLGSGPDNRISIAASL